MELKLCTLVNNIQNDIENHFYEDYKNDIIYEINDIVKTDNYDIVLTIISDENFYDVLTQLYCTLHYEKIIKVFLANLWYKKLYSLPKENQLTFLNLVLAKEVNTFGVLAVFKEFMTNKFNLSVEFFIEWFISLGKFVENDYCANLFYNGVAPFTENNKFLALKILNKLLNMEYSAIIHNLVSIILGILRVQNFNGIKKLDNIMKDTENITMQKYYYSSLVNTFCDNDVEIKELNTILKEILDKNNIEIESQAFFMAYRVFLSTKKSDVKDFISEWLIANSHHNLSNLSKHYCVEFAQRAIDNPDNINSINQILINIQPISNETKGTYKTLSFLLVKILQKHTEKFIVLLENILKQNDLSALLEEDYFINKFIGKINKTFFTKLFVSKKLNQRSFAQNIYIKNFDKLNLDRNVLLTVDDKLFELIFKETLLKINYGYIFSKFIIDLNARINVIENKSFKNFLDIEISYQCINFPQGCYESLQNYNQTCKLVKICVEKVTNYFDIINKFKDSPVNSFYFPSCYDAAIKGLTKQNKEILEETEKNSVFMAVCNSVEMLYGDKHAHRTAQGISDSELFTHLTHSVEIPILSFLDPISEVFRSINLNNDILRLRKEIIDAK